MTRTEQCLVAFLCLLLAALIGENVYFVMHSFSDAKVIDQPVCRVILPEKK